MADPLSITASVISVLGFTVQSCDFLVNFLDKIAGAPAEVEHNVIWLKALHSTFSQLHALGRDTQVELPPGFNARLEDCRADLLEVESRVRRVGQSLKAGRIQHTWTRLKYTFTAEQWFAKFSQRLQKYQTAFTLDLMMIQIKLTTSLINSNRIGCLPPNPTTVKPARDTCICANDSRLTRFLESYAEPISVRASSWHSFGTSLGRFAFWSGPTMTQRLSNKQLVYNVSSMTGGRGFGFQMRLGGRGSHKGVYVVFVLMKCPQLLGSLSMRWNIFFPRVVPREADIFEFVRTGNLAAVKSMFSMRRATPLHTSPDGAGLLHMAAKSEFPEMVRLLLQEGAQVDSRDEEGQTPLHFALAKSRNYDICRALLEYGADLGSRDISGKTPLHTFFSPALGMILTNHQEAIDDEIMTPDTAGMTILQYVAWSSKSEPEHLAPYLQCGEIYPFLARDYAGRSLLHFAAQRGNIAILKYFLSLPHDAGLKIRDTSGQSILHYAVYSKRIEVIDLLVSNGADIGAVDKNGRTVLHCAAMKNNLAAIERVVALTGRDSLCLRDRDGRTPVELAHRYKAFEVESWLKSLTTEVPDCEGDPHRPRVESKSGNPGSLTCYMRCGPLKSAHFVILVILLLWYIFCAPREWYLAFYI